MSTALTTLINRNKKSIWALLVLIASVPFNAFALGFGKPSVESALGEPLRIVLPLTALEPNEIDELVARLASPSWFQLSGLDYGEINDQLIVSVNPNLSAVVISTQQPVSQVVVPLVIELEGPRKVMRKQFTVLINPSTYEEAVASSSRVNLPSGLSLVEGVTGNIDATAGSTGLTPQAEIESDTLGAAGAGVTATPSALAGQSLPAQADRVIVARGDSLSTIVDRFLPQGANRFQGRMAFYNVNTSAFPDGNIHTLTQGAELIVPPAQDILALPAAQARRDYQSLAQQPIPAELLAASVGAEEDSGSANNAAGASVVSSEALENVDTADPKTTTEQQDGDFRLSLLELDESESLETEAASEDDTEKSTEAAVTDESLALSTETAGEPFEMQGFTMKLSVMNAYIVELQEENEELKSRVEALEKQVQALIARDSGQEGALASVTSSIAATSADAEADAEEGSPILQEAATDTQETIEEVLAGEEQDLAAVLETSPTLLDLEDSADQATVEEDTLDGMQESPTSSVSDTEVVADETALAEIEQTTVENVIDGLTKDPAAASDVSTSVDEMLAELDAELKESESNIAQIESDLDTISDANSEPETDSATQEVANEQIARNTLDSGDAQQLQPQDTFRQDLLNKAKNLFARFNGPISQLLVAVLLLAGLLFAWMVRRGKKKDSIEDSQPDMSTYASQANNNVGVTYIPDNQLSLLEDDEDEQWMSQPDVNMENIDSLDGADVDLITQSEVYLTYNRPMQAVQALMEEYAKPDTDKFVVGSRLIKVFEKIGSSEERNTAMRSFIVTLNNDIEEFTNSEWDALRFDLDALRRQEQSSAVEKEEEPSLDMNSFNPTLEPDNDKGLGSLSLDESSIDLDFHKIDKSG
ncbi:MAG: hypothetical protein KTR32_33690 [Granulosicoccus sp.]|nr:hypothetical protein [Granulosicoccus sp.]